MRKGKLYFLMFVLVLFLLACSVWVYAAGQQLHAVPQGDKTFVFYSMMEEAI